MKITTTTIGWCTIHCYVRQTCNRITKWARIGEALLSVARGVDPHLSVESTDPLDLRSIRAALAGRYGRNLKSIRIDFPGRRPHSSTRYAWRTRGTFALGGFTVIAIHRRDATRRKDVDRNHECLESRYENTEFNPDSPADVWIAKKQRLWWRRSRRYHGENRSRLATSAAISILFLLRAIIRSLSSFVCNDTACSVRNEKRRERKRGKKGTGLQVQWRARFAREKEWPFVTVARADPGIKYWFLTRLESL